jgi:hypothetical protein
VLNIEGLSLEQSYGVISALQFQKRKRKENDLWYDRIRIDNENDLANTYTLAIPTPRSELVSAFLENLLGSQTHRLVLETILARTILLSRRLQLSKNFSSFRDNATPNHISAL